MAGDNVGTACMKIIFNKQNVFLIQSTSTNRKKEALREQTAGAVGEGKKESCAIQFSRGSRNENHLILFN
jgi:hypothetical protein